MQPEVLPAPSPPPNLLETRAPCVSKVSQHPPPECVSNTAPSHWHDPLCPARRNSEPGSIFADDETREDIYGDNIEVDYRGYEVTVENFIRVLTGTSPPPCSSPSPGR